MTTRKRESGRKGLGAAWVLLCLLTAEAQGRPGDPDPTFGRGTVVTRFGSDIDQPLGAALGSDGKIVAAGYTVTDPPEDRHFAIARYTRDGLPDSDFGDQGKVTTVFGNGSRDAASAVAVHPDGGVVAGGETCGSTGCSFAIARYDVTGRLDASFGTGGTVATSFVTGGYSGVSAVALQADGKIVAAGSLLAPEGPDSRVALARYRSDGSLDAAFGNAGLVVLGEGTARHLALLGDGRILVAGTMRRTATGRDVFLARLHADGSLDRSFGDCGVVVVDLGEPDDESKALLVQEDGRPVLAGFRNDEGPTDDAPFPALRVVRFAADGTLDAAFGAGGIATPSFPFLYPQAIVLREDPEGRLLVARKEGIVRLRADGSNDDAFGRGGIVEYDYGYLNGSIGTLLLQDDGKIVGIGDTAVRYYPLDLDFALARYEADGSLDAGFGTGRGFVMTRRGGFQRAADILAQPDGKIVAAGSSGDFFVARYLHDGQLDPTFGDRGVAEPAFSSVYGDAQALALTPDGRIVAAGRAVDTTSSGTALVRYDATGARDRSFGEDGIVFRRTPGTTDDGARALVLEPDGGMVVAGLAYDPLRTRYSFGLSRYLADGSLDPSFGQGGIVTTDLGTGSDGANELVRQPDGKLVAIGFTSSWTGSDPFSELSRGFALARYDSDGSLDPSFGEGGRVVVPSGAVGWAEASGVALLPDGGILVAGHASATTGGNSDQVLFRIDPDGRLDRTFGSDGIITLDFSPNDQFGTILRQPDGRILACSTAGVLRLAPDGSLDPTFGMGGRAGAWPCSALTVDGSGNILTNSASYFVVARLLGGTDVEPVPGDEPEPEQPGGGVADAPDLCPPFRDPAGLQLRVRGGARSGRGVISLTGVVGLPQGVRVRDLDPEANARVMLLGRDGVARVELRRSRVRLRERGYGEVAVEARGRLIGAPVSPSAAPLRVTVMLEARRATMPGVCAEDVFVASECRPGTRARLVCRKRPPAP